MASSRLQLRFCRLSCVHYFDLFAHEMPQMLDMASLGCFGTDGNPNHPASVKYCGGKIGPAGVIDLGGPSLRMAVKLLAVQPARFVPDTNGLKMHRRHDVPVRGCLYLPFQPLGVGEVAAQPRLQAANPLGADQTPEL